VGTLVALVAAVGLAAVPYRVGSGRWHLEWIRTTWDIGLVLFVVFLPWFVLAMGIGASGTLIPLVMILFAAAFGLGRWDIWRRIRSRR